MNVTLSKRGSYAAAAAICLARAYESGRPKKLREVSAEMAIPRTFASQILGDLVHAGIAVSAFGRDGGHRLARPPEQISVAEVIEAAEGRLASGRCALRDGPCRWNEVCPLHETMTTATAALREVLTSTTLATLADRDAAIASGAYPVPADSHRQHTEVIIADSVQVELPMAVIAARFSAATAWLTAVAQACDQEEPPDDRQSKTVTVHLGEAEEVSGTRLTPLIWEATGPGGVYPRFHGELRLTALDPERSELSVRGSYRPAPRMSGNQPGETPRDGAAQATLRHFLRRVASRLEHEHAAQSLRRANGRCYRRVPCPRACQHSGMGQELTQVLCPECGTAGESDPGLSRWQCSKCGNSFFLRRCSACARVSYVDGLQGFRMPWPCSWCGRFNRGFSQNQDPAAATAAELAAEIARCSPARSGAELGAGSRPDPAQAADLRPGPAAPIPADAPRSGRRWVGRIVLSALVASAAAACVLLVAGGPSAGGTAAGLAGHGGATRTVQVTLGQVGAIDFHGVPGQLAIAGTGPGKVVLTGQLRGTRSAPVIETRLDRVGGVLDVSIRCAPDSSCTESLRLTVPAGVGTTLRQSGGRVVLAGLTGPLCLTTANADVSASGLRSPSLMAVITRGHLSTAFTTVPRKVSITLTSAQATLRLPASVTYRIAREVTSGHVKVAIPQAASAPRTVTARIHSGELELLPS